MDARQAALGPTHPYTIAACSDLVAVLSVRGKFEEIEGLQTRVLQAKKLDLGPRDPETLRHGARASTSFGPPPRDV